jgi:hypothetical protein
MKCKRKQEREKREREREREIDWVGWDRLGLCVCQTKNHRQRRAQQLVAYKSTNLLKRIAILEKHKISRIFNHVQQQIMHFYQELTLFLGGLFWQFWDSKKAIPVQNVS